MLKKRRDADRKLKEGVRGLKRQDVKRKNQSSVKLTLRVLERPKEI
jgi:hypothetical protein